MSKYQAINKNDFSNLRWSRFENYHFAALDAVAPLVAQELPRACVSLPIAFILQNDKFTPVAIQGLQAGKNLFVTTDGRWIGTYAPAVYRGYPFALGSADNGQDVLCIDMESGLIGEANEERFFDDDGQPSEAVKSVLDFLVQVRADRLLTERLCRDLQDEGLIQTWPLTLKSEQGEQIVEGLYRIDEARFNNLEPEALNRLHKSGALILVYCQLLSIQHLQTLGKLMDEYATAKSNASLSTQKAGELDLEFLNSSGTISFGNLS